MISALTTGENVGHWAGAAADVATVAAIVVGGWWTYTRFIKQRTGNVRAALSQAASHRQLTDDDALLRVVLRIENTGAVLMPIEEIRCEIYQVAPPTADTLAMLEKHELIDRDDYNAQLPCIQGYTKEWAKKQVEIEPGEFDTFAYDFIVSTEVTTIFIYAHVPNSTKAEGIGWDVSDFYDTKSAGALPGGIHDG
jgi:hypothetical protein